MLHGTPTSDLTRHGRLTTTTLLVLVAALLSFSARPAQALSRTADIAGGEGTIKLVRLADGSVRVERGLSFHTTGSATILAEDGGDVTLSTSLVDLSDTLTADGIVSDDHRVDQWGLDLLGAETIWQRADGADQVIAIVDSGVDGAHPDLTDQLVDGHSSTGGDPLVDGHGHGTHVAGTAAAAAGNAYGVAGLAHAAKIMPIQVTDEQGLAYASDVAEGLIWAVDHGATVANLSLAGTQESNVLNGAIDYAISSGVVIVVAAGNEYGRGNPRTYPASHPDVIAVGAVRNATTRASFSSTGDWVDIMAPGSAILSTRPDDTFAYASGTSMASPTIAGAVALLRSTTELSPAQVADTLTATAIDIGASGRDDQTGHGLVDVNAALDALGVETPAVPEDDEPSAEELVEDLTDGEDATSGDFTGDTGSSQVAVPEHLNADIDDATWVSQGWGV